IPSSSTATEAHSQAARTYVRAPRRSHMKAMVVRIAREALVAEDREVPQPGRAEVRIRVHACGVCHSDQFVTEVSGPGSGCRAFPGMRWRAWSMRSARACLRFVWV